MYSDLCRSAHATLAAGKCPWCGCMIIKGLAPDERIVSAHQDKDTAKFARYRKALRPMLLSLDPELLAVIELRYVKGRTIEDIARDLNVSIPDVMTRLSRAKELIRAKIKTLEM